MDDESGDSRISSDDAHVMCGAKTSLNGKFTEILSDIIRYYEILSDVIRYYQMLLVVAVYAESPERMTPIGPEGWKDDELELDWTQVISNNIQ